MAQLISVRLSRHDSQPLGFRLQGGKDFGTPLAIQKVNGGSPAERAGLQAGDAVIKVNNTDVYNLRHKEAQDAIIAAGQNLDLTIQRGGGTWRPSVTNIGTLPTPSSRSYGQISPVTKTSLRATPQASQAFGSGHNNVAKPFNYTNGDSTVKSIVNKQYNTPVGMYSEETIAETLSAQAEVLAGGVLGVNFKKNEKTYDSEKSEVFKMLQEADNDPEPEALHTPAPSGLRHVSAPVTRPDAPINNTGGLPPGQNICEECERLIIGVFVRIKDKNLHVECFKCATCGTSLKNQGYYNLNGKLYCDIHAKLVARQNPPAPHLEPVTIAPGGKFPANAISSALANHHTAPLPPLSTNNIGNGISPYSPPQLQYYPQDQIDNVPGLRLENVEAFNSVLKNEELAADAMKQAIPAQFSNGPRPTEKQLKLGNLSINTNGFSNEPMNERNNSFLASNANNATNPSHFRKVIPPHLGGDYKLSSNLSGPRPFGSAPQSTPSIASTLSPRSAPLSPAHRPVPPPAPSCTYPHAPVTPALQVVNNRTQNEQTTPRNQPSNDTLKKMSKFALDENYEIGIQRKIKPGGHIASMANMIKDTIIMKHPLNNSMNEVTFNSNNTPKSSTNSSPSHSRQSSSEKNLNSSKQWAQPQIQQYPLHINNSGGIPIPPPPPPLDASYRITFNDKANGVDYLSSTLNKKRQNLTNGTNGNSHSLTHKPAHNVCDSTVKSSVTPIRNNITSSSSGSSTGTLSPPVENKQNALPNGLSFQAHQLTNILLNKIASMPVQKDKPLMEIKPPNGHYNNGNEDKVLNKNSIPAHYMNGNSLKNGQINKDVEKKVNAINGNNNKNDNLHMISNLNINKSNDNVQNVPESKGNLKYNTETVLNANDIFDNSPVKMREKRTDRSSGKRDSKVVARPISTIASLDMVDGEYPICNKCEKQISRGPFITALGRIWCPDHFICVNASCRRPLQDIGFVEEQGQLYCEYCFEQFIAPACEKCHAKIKGDCLNAIGKHFHPECFNCAYCGKLFGNNPFFLEEGLPYCEADWNELFTTKCFACGFPVEAGDRWVEALNNNYHSQCFNCTMCKKNLEGQTFYAKGGRPFCKTHAR